MMQIFYVFVLVLCMLSVQSFTTITQRQKSAFLLQQQQQMRSLSMAKNNPRASGLANTKIGKAAILERTRALVATTFMIIAIPIDGVSKEQIDILRKLLPTTGVKASVVKNSLLRLTVMGTPFEPIATTISGENMFFFIQEGVAKQSYDAYKKWQKEVKRNEPGMFDPKYAAMEGQLFFTLNEVEMVTSLPTKKELITQMARTIKAVPLRLARTVKSIPNRVGHAFSAVKNKMEEDAKAAATTGSTTTVVAEAVPVAVSQ